MPKKTSPDAKNAESTAGAESNPQDDWLKPAKRKQVPAPQAQQEDSTLISAQLQDENGWDELPYLAAPPVIDDTPETLTTEEISKRFGALFQRFQVVQKEVSSVNPAEMGAFITKIDKLQKDADTFCSPVLQSPTVDKENKGRIRVFVQNLATFVRTVKTQAPAEQKMQEPESAVPMYDETQQLEIQEGTKRSFVSKLCCCCFFSSKSNKKVDKLKKGNEQGKDLLDGQSPSDADPEQVKTKGQAKAKAPQDASAYTTLAEAPSNNRM